MDSVGFMVQVHGTAVKVTECNPISYHEGLYSSFTPWRDIVLFLFSEDKLEID